MLHSMVQQLHQSQVIKIALFLVYVGMQPLCTHCIYIVEAVVSHMESTIEQKILTEITIGIEIANGKHSSVCGGHYYLNYLT